MTLENGETLSRQWNGRDRWVRYEFTAKSRPARVEVDPEHKILLDVNFANNSWVERPAPVPFTKWFSNLLFWAQAVLQ